MIFFANFGILPELSQHNMWPVFPEPYENMHTFTKYSTNNIFPGSSALSSKMVKWDQNKNLRLLLLVSILHCNLVEDKMLSSSKALPSRFIKYWLNTHTHIHGFLVDVFVLMAWKAVLYIKVPERQKFSEPTRTHLIVSGIVCRGQDLHLHSRKRNMLMNCAQKINMVMSLN